MAGKFFIPLLCAFLGLLLLGTTEVRGDACPLTCSSGGTCQFVQKELDVEFFGGSTVETAFQSPTCTAVFGAPNLIFQQMKPCAAASSADFSARLTGYIVAPTTGNYNFQVRHDDAFRLYVNNVLVLGFWAKGTGTVNSGNVAMTAGVYYPFKLEMVDYAAEAEWIVRWKLSSEGTYVIIPATAMFRPQCTCLPPWGGSQCFTQQGCTATTESNTQFPNAFSGTTAAGTCLEGFYSSGPSRTCTGTTWGPILNPCMASLPGPAVATCPQACSNGGTCMWKNGVKVDFYSEFSIGDLVNYVLTTTSTNINFGWGESQPTYGISFDFSVQLTAYLYPSDSGTYTLKGHADDAIRIWINGGLVYNRWTKDSYGSYTSNSFSMNANTYYHLKIEVMDNGGGAGVTVNWQSGSISEVNIPASNYFQGICACPAPWTGETCGTRRGCLPETASNAVWPATFSENTVVGSCLTNFYSSNPTRYCQGNTWNTASNPCTQVYCQVNNEASGSWPQTAAGTSATITCASGYYSPGTPTRSCTHVSGSVGTWSAVTNPCTACNCGAGSSSSNCNGSGACSCQPGYTGTKCNQCLPNHFGSSCQACPNCMNGTCSDELGGTGACSCSPGWMSSPSSAGCDICVDGRYGPACSGVCPTCNHGECQDGVSGSGECQCEQGWAHDGPSYCSVCAPGYVLVGEECLPCDPTCLTCDGTLATNCLNCPGNLQYEASNKTCSSECPPGQYSEDGFCTPCHGSCDTCITGGSSGCSTCPSDAVYDAGSCPSSCQTPRTFNNSGICTTCSIRCQTCHGTATVDCLSCLNGYVLDTDGSCASTCHGSNYYVDENSVCQECHESCATCNAGGPSQCLTCPPSSYLNEGSCVGTCPHGKFADAQGICQHCSPTCETCTGPGFSDCTSCDANGALPYLDDGLCSNRCGFFRYAPVNSHTCQDCVCNGHSTSCNDDGVCQSCNGLTTGSNCQLCAPNAFRLEANVSLPCETCECNGLSATCNSSNGTCTACTGNTQGPHCDQCKPGFVQFVPGVGCSIVNCPAITEDGTFWPATLLGTNATGTCTAGYYSPIPPTRNCTNSGVTAVWDGLVENSCDVIYCRSVNESGTIWPQTAAGDVVTGNCSNGFVPETPPTRTCLASGSKGIWGGISNPCETTTSTDNTFTEIGVPILVAGLVVILLGILGILLFMYMGKKRKHELKMVEMMQPGSTIHLADFETFSGGANNTSLTQHSRSSRASGNTTMINTIIDGNISLPGFLMMSYENDIREEKMIASGGGGKISFGVIVNSDLRTKYPLFADSIAIKSVERGEGVSAENALASFHQEVAVLNTLSYHPNVIKLLGYTEEPNCIITPLYQGDLNSLIHLKEKHSYTSLDAMDLVAQMVAAIDAVHSIMVAHRDIKPSNFLLEPRHIRSVKSFAEWSSFPYKVRLCDFGICYVDSDQAKPILQVYNQFGFSVRYAAPEVFSKLIQPSSNAGLLEFQSADMYSFGVCLWELLHRQIPWPTDSFEEIQHKVLDEQRPLITLAESSDFKAAFLAQLIAMCWHQSPISRPSFRNVINQMRDFMGNEPTPYAEIPLL